MIGGKVLDPSALAAYVQGSLAIDSWLVTAAHTGIVLYVPQPVMTEFRAVYPGADLTDLLSYPWVIQAGFDWTDASDVAQLLIESPGWDGTAGHVVLVARHSGLRVVDRTGAG
ncbi:MAG: hypothetical protein ACT4NY_30070 [Pseudonocardiales bacterium]